MGAKYTEAQKRASLAYQKDKAQMKITVKKEKHERYQKHAESKNISLTKLIESLLDKDIEESKY